MSENPGPPQPNLELARLERLVGTWSMEGHLVGSDETTIRGETTFRWLPGGFFLEQHVTPARGGRTARSPAAGGRIPAPTRP
jgi:hypothetical protein